MRDGVGNAAYVTGHVARAVLCKTGPVVHFNSLSDQGFIFLAILVAS